MSCAISRLHSRQRASHRARGAALTAPCYDLLKFVLDSFLPVVAMGVDQGLNEFNSHDSKS